MHLVRRRSLTPSTESDALFPAPAMHLVRRGSLTPAIESNPIVPAPAIESDRIARFREGMFGEGKAFSASVDIMPTAGPAGATVHSFNGEDETMQVNY